MESALGKCGKEGEESVQGSQMAMCIEGKRD